MGQPTKCTPERQKIILEFIRKGCYKQTACDAAGIAYNTFRRWNEYALEGREPYSSFSEAIKKADSDFLGEIHDIVLGTARKQLPNTWQAGITLAERTHRELYGQPKDPSQLQEAAELINALVRLKGSKEEPPKLLAMGE